MISEKVDPIINTRVWIQICAHNFHPAEVSKLFSVCVKQLTGEQVSGAAVPLRDVNGGSQVQSVSGSLRGGVHSHFM